MERAQLSRLAQERLDRNWTQGYVAEQVGVDPGTVRRWESGRSTPQPRQQWQLCKLFDKTPEALGLPSSALSPGDHEEETPSAQERQLLPMVSLSERTGAYARFRAYDLTTRLEHLVWTWPIQHVHARYHELQALIIQELEQKDNTMQETPISRRNALRRLASLPIEMSALSLAGPIFIRPVEEILTQCAAGVAACWDFKGRDLAFTDDVVSHYIPTLHEIVKTGTGTYPRDAASLLAQCLLLKATCTCYISANHITSLHYRKQAGAYAEFAGNLELTILATSLQASSHDYADNWEQARQTAERAKYLFETAPEETLISPHLKSLVYIALANYQAHSSQRYKQDALRSLGQAQTTLYAAGNEPAPIWARRVEASLLMNGGLVYYHLDMTDEAIASFTKVDVLPEVSETLRTESYTDRVMAEVNRDDKPRDMEFCITHWKQGMQSAIALRSEQSYTEAKTAYAALRGAWPNEQSIKDLRERITHW